MRGLSVLNPAFAALNNTFERALVTMHKMPKIWELYLAFLVEQKVITKVRRACDRALASLPVTQHERVWTIYLVRARAITYPVLVHIAHAHTHHLIISPLHKKKKKRIPASQPHFSILFCATKIVVLLRSVWFLFHRMLIVVNLRWFVHPLFQKNVQP